MAPARPWARRVRPVRASSPQHHPVEGLLADAAAAGHAGRDAGQQGGQGRRRAPQHRRRDQPGHGLEGHHAAAGQQEIGGQGRAHGVAVESLAADPGHDRRPVDADGPAHAPGQEGGRDAESPAGRPGGTRAAPGVEHEGQDGQGQETFEPIPGNGPQHVGPEGHARQGGDDEQPQGPALDVAAQPAGQHDVEAHGQGRAHRHGQPHVHDHGEQGQGDQGRAEAGQPLGEAAAKGRDA